MCSSVTPRSDAEVQWPPPGPSAGSGVRIKPMANELTAGRAHVSLTTSSLNANFSHRTSSRARSDQVAQSNSTSRA